MPLVNNGCVLPNLRYAVRSFFRPFFNVNLSVLTARANRVRLPLSGRAIAQLAEVRQNIANVSTYTFQSRNIFGPRVSPWREFNFPDSQYI